jgi:predicted O-methyltransferase YrrM
MQNQLVNKKERELYLKDAYRMFGLKDDEGGVNKTEGLFMMCRDIMKEDFVVAEIGSYAGVSSEVLALHCTKLHCIDTWEDWNHDGIIFQAMELFDNMRSLYTHIDKLHMRGEEAAKLFPDGHFDLVYIDASHWYNDVMSDINTWLPKIKNGGYLAGHDYIEGIDVLYAVNDYFGKTHSITRYPDSSWLIKKN